MQLSDKFGIGFGGGYLYRDNLSFAPVFLTVKRDRLLGPLVGFELNYGYAFPVSGEGEDNVTSYELKSGGFYFNPMLSLELHRDETIAISMVTGYRVFAYQESYTEFVWGGENRVDADITSRSLHVGLAISFSK
jgi:hypothetical protein